MFTPFKPIISYSFYTSTRTLVSLVNSTATFKITSQYDVAQRDFPPVASVPQVWIRRARMETVLPWA
jgi:hypothetical protein